MKHRARSSNSAAQLTGDGGCAARLLPLFGLFLIGLLLLGPNHPGNVPHPTARDVVWQFTVWAELIVIAPALAPGQGASVRRDDKDAMGGQASEGTGPTDSTDDAARVPAGAAETAPIGRRG